MKSRETGALAWMTCVLSIACSGSSGPEPEEGTDASGSGGAGLYGSGGTLLGTGGTGGQGTSGADPLGTGGQGDAPPVIVDGDPVAPLELIPQPVTTALGVGHVHLSADTRLVAPGAARTVADVLGEVLRTSTGLPLPVVDALERGGDIVFQIDSSLSSLGSEGYELEVTQDRTYLRASTAAGLFYATTTLRQLLPAQIESASVVPGTTWRLPRVTIQDRPRFAWRGLSFDVARHFFDVEEVIRLIDLASFHKLNRLHLHLTDDQGWRLVIDSWPNLVLTGGSTQVGGGPGGYFTKEDYGSLVSYAAARFVTIVPEIDLPGHTNAALASYGELNSTGNPTALYTGTEVGFSSLWLGQEVTMNFVDDVLGEVAALTPGPYLHIGGDEATVTDDNEYKAFIAQVQDIVTKYGKTTVGWCEIGRAALDSGAIVQDWHKDSEPCAAAGVSQGAQVIFSPAQHAYLDMKYDENTPWGHDWAGTVSVAQAYEWDPAERGVASDKILGVEAAVWTEFIDDRMAVDRMVFPRLCGHAEIGWSPADRSFEEYKGRLGHHGQRLEALGVDFYRAPEITWK